MTAARVRYYLQRAEVRIRRFARKTRRGVPWLLDAAGNVAAVVGVAALFGAGWAWLTAAGLLMLAAQRLQP